MASKVASWTLAPHRLPAPTLVTEVNGGPFFQTLLNVSAQNISLSYTLLMCFVSQIVKW